MMDKTRWIPILESAMKAFSVGPTQRLCNSYGLCLYFLEVQDLEHAEIVAILSIVPGVEVITRDYMFSGDWHTWAWLHEDTKFERRDWCEQAIKILESE